MCTRDIRHAFKSYKEDQKKFKLLISFLKPHSAVTVKTISRWIKTYLKEASIDTNTFQGYSLRNSSSTKAKLWCKYYPNFKRRGWSN